ncbi:MAG: lytic murein transglycosylase [Pseudomonadota bacterium]
MKRFSVLAAVSAVSLMISTPAAAQWVDPNRAASADAANAFQGWLRGFRDTALAAGVGAATLDRELAGLTYNPRVVRLDRSQPEGRTSTGPILPGYLERRLTPSRIEPGRRLAVELDDELARVERDYGVDGEVILGIWGMETNYGGYTGNFDAVRSLATLAFDGRREALFTGELIAALKMIDGGLTRRDQMIGSWAGALGNPQFLPSSYLKLAVDGDGDAKPDIWGSAPDTLGSIANYLRAEGWQPDVPWAVKVNVPAAFDRGSVAALEAPTECARVYAKHSRMLPIAEWKRLGLVPADGKGFPSDEVRASLVEIDGQGTDAYLATSNYRAILGYNCSNYYAVSVGTLADLVADARPGAAGGL